MLITDLPIEIQSLIFSEIYWAERENLYDSDAPILTDESSDGQSPVYRDDQQTQWRHDLQRVPNLFPHTTASVCRLWQNILSKTPRYWTRFVLDLDDPACLPFDVFGWSKSGRLNVVIRSHPPEISEDAKIRENKQVLSAFQALIPYIPSCKSIVFDVKFASSLPSPTPFLCNEIPHLEVLVMDSEIDDVVLPIALDRTPNTTMSQNIPNMANLALYGPAFIELSKIYPTLLEDSWITEITLAHLKCCWKNGSPYTINELLKFLTITIGRWTSRVTFKHTRFVGEQPSCEEINPDEVEFTIEPCLAFEEVDPNFMRVFAPYASRAIVPNISIKNCTLPWLEAFRDKQLYLRDIPDAESLKNVIFLHTGPPVTFTSCAGFNDDFLNWLATSRCPPALSVLRIYKCGNFTFGALRTFLETRNVDNVVPEAFKEGGEDDYDHSEDSDEDCMPDEDEDEDESEDSDGGSVLVGLALGALVVQNSGLRLTDEDISWLNEFVNGGRVSIDWWEGDQSII